MKIVIDINHPKNVHIFKHLIFNLQHKGHKVVFTCLDKEFTKQLLDAYNFYYYLISKHKKNLFKKVLNFFKYIYKLLWILRKEKPDLCLSQGSIYLSFCAYILKIPHISLHDTENSKLNNYLPMKLSNCVIASESFRAQIKNKNNVRFPGCLENAYLHPNYFKKDNETHNYIFIRFVAWGATHDIGHNGISLNNKILAVKRFSKYGKVFVSSESRLPQELEKYKININPVEIHIFLSKCKLFFGESATMATEAALLGVPSIYLDNESRGYTMELEEKYGLLFNFTESYDDQLKAIRKGIDILNKYDYNYYQKLRERYFKNTIDLTKLLEEKIENNDCLKKTVWA